jgi:hypothetical protein
MLCEPGDAPALWAARELQRRARFPLAVVSGADLARATAWEVRIVAGRWSTAIRLADGRELVTSSLRGVVNRLWQAPTQIAALAEGADREYITGELTALHLSWLGTLACPVINRPAPFALAGPYLGGGQWAGLAAAAGLNPLRNSYSSEDEPWAPAPSAPGMWTSIVAGDQVFGPRLPAVAQQGCVALARAAGAALLGIDFVRRRSELMFVNANPLPDLRIAGEAGITALVGLLEGPGGAP